VSTTVTVTVKPQWLVTCDGCSFVRRYEDERAASIAALVHERDCPGQTPLIDKKPSRS
jgi:hypothetical protein